VIFLFACGGKDMTFTSLLEETTIPGATGWSKRLTVFKPKMDRVILMTLPWLPGVLLVLWKIGSDFFLTYEESPIAISVKGEGDVPG
jgi:hypothetical protein